MDNFIDSLDLFIKFYTNRICLGKIEEKVWEIDYIRGKPLGKIILSETTFRIEFPHRDIVYEYEGGIQNIRDIILAILSEALNQ